MSRLCDPLDGTNTGIISEFLGVESNYKPVSQPQVELDPALNSGEHKFDVCKSLFICCPFDDCRKTLEIRNLFHLFNKQDTSKIDVKELSRLSGSELFKLTLANCEYCHKPFTEITQFYFELELRKQIQQHIDRFYRKLMTCDDHACSYKTLYPTGNSVNNSIRCSRCKHGILQPEVR